MLFLTPKIGTEKKKQKLDSNLRYGPGFANLKCVLGYREVEFFNLKRNKIAVTFVSYIIELS